MQVNPAHPNRRQTQKGRGAFDSAVRSCACAPWANVSTPFNHKDPDVPGFMKRPFALSPARAAMMGIACIFAVRQANRQGRALQVVIHAPEARRDTLRTVSDD